MRKLLPVVLVLFACGKGGPKTASWTMYALGRNDSPPGGLKVSASVPGEWTTEVGKDGSPTFKHGDANWPVAVITVMPCRAKERKECLDQVISLQFEKDELATAKTEDIGGNPWIEKQSEKNGRVHARLFMPLPDQQLVVMCIAMMVEPKDLPAVKSFCQTVKIGS